MHDHEKRTPKKQSLKTPKVHGMLFEYLQEIANHPARYSPTMVDDPKYSDFLEWERELRTSLSEKLGDDTETPDRIRELATAINGFLEPQHSEKKKPTILSGLSAVAASMQSGARRLLGRQAITPETLAPPLAPERSL